MNQTYYLRVVKPRLTGNETKILRGEAPGWTLEEATAEAHKAGRASGPGTNIYILKEKPREEKK